MAREPHDELIFVLFTFLAAVALLAVIFFALATKQGHEQGDRFVDIPQSPGNVAAER